MLVYKVSKKIHIKAGCIFLRSRKISYVCIFIDDTGNNIILISSEEFDVTEFPIRFKVNFVTAVLDFGPNEHIPRGPSIKDVGIF